MKISPPKVLKCTQGGLHTLRCLTTEDQMNSDKTSTKIGSETTRTYRDHVVQTLLHLPCRPRQSNASSSRPIPAATLFLAASGGLDPLRRRYAPASPRPIRTPNEMNPPLAVPEGSQACWSERRGEQRMLCVNQDAWNYEVNSGVGWINHSIRTRSRRSWMAQSPCPWEPPSAQ